MPEIVLKELIVSRLKDTDYDPSKLSTSKSVAYLFKNYITALDDNISILDKDMFEAIIDINEYNQIVYTETIYGLMRIARQCESINALLRDGVAPKAWLIVTVYYHSFFCANLINRLLGRYSCYFTKKEINGIRAWAINPRRKDLAHGNYVGYYVSCDDGEVRIRFKNEGDKPHYTVWKHLHDRFEISSIRNSDDVKRVSRIQLFKKIINDNVRMWPSPSEIRNMWNYTDIVLYSKKGDEIAREFCAMLVDSKDLKWASGKVAPDKKNTATSVAFISSTLNRSLEVCKSKILR